ncbi:MAG: hypothetical protein PHQ96_09625 [Candidatus Omnitrophica bacterium]|nr:hypothetical protein [Candidatus Omnitrophota bacterium]
MKKAVILVIVMGITLVLSALALIALYIMTNESRIAEHKIRRMRAFYAAQGGAVHAFERLRREGTEPLDRTAIGGNSTDVVVGGTGVDLTVTPASATEPSDFRVRASVDY